MKQISSAHAEHAGKRKKTRREVFLAEMELVVPWKALLKVIEPHYPWRSWASALSARNDVSGAPDAKLVRAERTRDGGSLVRDGFVAHVRGSGAGVDSRRDDDHELPPPAGSQ
ncbi:hypothetical protein J2X90_005136 [Variovorax paradoxus]|nr:hypothetical protein [Variovorax paradoxus]